MLFPHSDLTVTCEHPSPGPESRLGSTPLLLPSRTEPAVRRSVLFPRNVLTESARIARGKITDLAQLRAANHDAAIFPGGFGAAKNLCVFELGAFRFSLGMVDGDRVVP